MRQARSGQARRARVVAMVNVEMSALADAADAVIPLRAGPEISVAATKSFLCSLSAIAHVAGEWKDDDTLRAALRTRARGVERRRRTRLAYAHRRSRRRGQPVRRRARTWPRRRAGSCAQAQGDLRHPRRSVQRGRGAAWTDGAGRTGISGRFLVQDDDTKRQPSRSPRNSARAARRVCIAGAELDGAMRCLCPRCPHPASTPHVAVHRFYESPNALAVRAAAIPTRRRISAR